MAHAACKIAWLRQWSKDSFTQPWQRPVRLGNFSRPMRSFQVFKGSQRGGPCGWSSWIEDWILNDVDASRLERASWCTAGTITVWVAHTSLYGNDPLFMDSTIYFRSASHVTLTPYRYEYVCTRTQSLVLGTRTEYDMYVHPKLSGRHPKTKTQICVIPAMWCHCAFLSQLPNSLVLTSPTFRGPLLKVLRLLPKLRSRSSRANLL